MAWESEKAFRRCKGYSASRFGGIEIAVHYLTVRQLRAVFSPRFRLRLLLGHWRRCASVILWEPGAQSSARSSFFDGLVLL